jgi:DNA-binding response OmpR family regulator
MRLLIVEDQARIAELLKQALARASFAADILDSCKDAQEALALTPYDGMILDLGLPDGDGMDILQNLRAAGSQLPVLILTARDAVEHRVCGLDRKGRRRLSRQAV